MVHLFYSLAAFFIYFEVSSFINARHMIEETQRVEKLAESIRQSGARYGTDTFMEYLKWFFMDFLYVLWSLAGLLSSQWLLFFGLFILTLMSIMVKSRQKEISVEDAVKFDRANSLFSVILLVTIVGNKFWNWFDVPRSILEVMGVW